MGWLRNQESIPPKQISCESFECFIVNLGLHVNDFAKQNEKHAILI